MPISPRRPGIRSARRFDITHVNGRPLARPILAAGIYWNQCDPSCPGWLHIQTEDGQPRCVQACDSCARFRNARDPEAVARMAHRYECGCPHPEREANA